MIHIDMDQKILVIIAAVVVVAAAGGGAYYFLTKDNEPASDYTLLDDGKLEKGVTFVQKENVPGVKVYEKYVIESVESSFEEIIV